MANITLLKISIIIIFGIVLIISIPIFIISTTIAPYGIIDEEIPFYYNPSNSSSMKDLNINSDIGKVEIFYIYEPVDYSAKVEVRIEMIGLGLAEKAYYDYFSIVWENTSGYVNFSLKFKAGLDQGQLLSLIKNINIIVTLKTDVLCDINVIISIQGGVNIMVPWGISIGSILANISRGHIQYNFYNCILKGNITGIIQDVGDIIIKSYDMEYIQNNRWSLSTNRGDISIEINQNKATNANITGTALIVDGMLDLFYKDNSANIGAYFYFPLLSYANTPPQDGFNIIFQGEKTWLISADFPTIYNYNLTIYIMDPCTRCRNIELHSD